MPKPVFASGLANCGVRIRSSVAGFTTGPFFPFPSANKALTKRARSFTVEYMHPAGAMPSSKVGAGNSRPW